MAQFERDIAPVWPDSSVLHDVVGEFANADARAEPRAIVHTPALTNTFNPAVHGDDPIRRRRETMGFHYHLGVIQGAHRLRFRSPPSAADRIGPKLRKRRAPYQ